SPTQLIGPSTCLISPRSRLTVRKYKRKARPGLLLPGPSLCTLTLKPRAFRFSVHSAHAAAVAAGHRRFLLLFRNLRHERFRREQERRDGRRVLERRTHDLGRVDDARLHQILVSVREGIEAF